ncbi:MULTISPECIES: ABC transporter permease subunit [Cupriavidus]|uniref:ABC transporter permease subunit n=1 Tax=Cupriavidus TaxID=106589 RepID=UPI001F0FD20A|nr:ABC transporter permease subunit [Cupriavidus oxalaticus]
MVAGGAGGIAGHACRGGLAGDRRDIEEAAMMDGLSRFGAFLTVVVPVSSSGILTVVIFSMTLAMQEFVYAPTFITVAGFTVGAIK